MPMKNCFCCVPLRQGCIVIASAYMVLRLSDNFRHVVTTKWSVGQEAVNGTFKIIWTTMLIFMNILLFMAAIKEHMCLAFTVAYVDFLQLVAYNMYRISYVTNHVIHMATIARLCVEFVADLYCMVVVYSYYMYLRNRNHESEDAIIRAIRLSHRHIYEPPTARRV